MLDIDTLWSDLQQNPNRVYRTSSGKEFMCCFPVGQSSHIRIQRIDGNHTFMVKTQITKGVLKKTLELSPTHLSQITKKIWGASYCFAIIHADYKEKNK